MNLKPAGRMVAFLAVGLLGAAASPADAPSASTDSDPRIVHEQCIGIPSEQHRVSFEGSSEGTSVIKEVLVHPGDTVKAGDVLLREDTSAAEAELAVLKAGADATGAIGEQQATIDAKSKLVDMLNRLSSSNYSGRDMIDAKLDLDVATWKKKQAEEQHEQQQLAYQRQLIKVQHMTLRSPIDGVVESVSLFAGEEVDSSSDKNGPCFVVSNNPLWIEFHLRASQAAKLALHDKVDVAFPDEPGQWHTGDIVFLDPMVAYVDQTRTVRVSMPNPDNRPSGLPMIVRLPEKAAAEADAGGSVIP